MPVKKVTLLKTYTSGYLGDPQISGNFCKPRNINEVKSSWKRKNNYI